MKLFLSLFLSVCISLAPLYSSAESPIDLEPMYNITPKEKAEKIQALLSDPETMKTIEDIIEESKAVLNDPSARHTVLAEYSDSELEETRAFLNNFDMKERRAKLNEPSVQKDIAELLVNLDEEHLQNTESNNESFKKWMLSHNAGEQTDHSFRGVAGKVADMINYMLFSSTIGAVLFAIIIAVIGKKVGGVAAVLGGAIGGGIAGAVLFGLIALFFVVAVVGVKLVFD